MVFLAVTAERTHAKKGLHVGQQKKRSWAAERQQ